MAILVGTEILINGQWLDIESSEALRFLQPLRDAAAAGLSGFERELERIFATLTRPIIIMDAEDTQAQEALRALSIRLSGLSTVEIIYGTHPVLAECGNTGCIVEGPHSDYECRINLANPTDAIAALNAKAHAHAQPTACARCLYHSGSPLLACAVHPKGRPGEDCGDWEDGATDAARAWRCEAELTTRNAELEACEDLTTRNQREYAEAACDWIAVERRRERLARQQTRDESWVEYEVRIAAAAIALNEATAPTNSPAVFQLLVCRDLVLREMFSDGSTIGWHPIPDDAAFGDVRWVTPPEGYVPLTNSSPRAPGEYDRAGA